MKLLVAIPCLNEAESIRSVLEAIPSQIQGIDEILKVVIDDGSTDQTAVEAAKAGAVVVSHGYNRGVGAAFHSAVEFALRKDVDFMVNIDADRQFDPNDIPKLLQPLLTGEADFVTASRFIDPAYYPKMPRIKFWGNIRMAGLISFLSGRQLFDVACGFRAYSREVLLNLNLQGQFTYTQETLLDLTFKNFRIKEVPVHVQYFHERRSRVANNLFKYAFNASMIIFRCYRDYHPLRFFWFIAGCLFLVSIGFGSILLVHFLRTGLFSGQIWAGFTAGFFFMIGLSFFISGIVTDMLNRQRANQERTIALLKRINREIRLQ